MRSRPFCVSAALLLVLTACATSPRASTTIAQRTGTTAAVRESPEVVRSLLSALADDSMEGRASGTRGAARAAAFIAAQMRRIGLEPAGDSGYFQRIPVVIRRTAMRPRGGRTDTTYVNRPILMESFSALDSVPADRRRTEVNVVGILRGSDPTARDSAIVVGAHFDHLGIRTPVNGDSIYNGADDDASGVVAVLEIARALKSETPPKRTIVFVAFTGEEVGGLGSHWYMTHPVVPLERTPLELEVEMIARPDSLAGGPGKAWLTGYERSTMGDMLRDAGIPIVPDPRPDQNFFRRSDNYAFAVAGIPAHTLSTFNLHGDYHQPSDEVDKADFDHMARVIEAATAATRILANGPAPHWKPGGQPERSRDR